MRRAAALFLGLALAVGSPLAQGDDPAPLDRTEVPRLADAGAQLALARSWKGRRIGAEPARREFWSRRAVEAYRAVRLYFPEAREVAEAGFRAAGLLATLGETASVLAELEVAVAHGEGTEYRARGLLEIGHVHRRTGEPAAALDAYHRVATDAHAAARHRDDAWWWTGEVLLSIGSGDAARRAYRFVAEKAEDPRRRVLAFDRLGCQLMDEGDLEGAAGVLHECRRALDTIAREETKQGERVRRALQEMRLVEALPRRIASRWRKNAEKSSERKP